jgi:hypothetical protein
MGHLNIGPTQADMAELNLYKPTRFPMPTKFHWLEDLTEEDVESRYFKTASTMYDHDWERIAHCVDPRKPSPRKGLVYTPGCMNGFWVGRMLVSVLMFFMTSYNTL